MRMWFQRLWRTIARFFSWLAGDHQKLQEDADETIAATPFDIQPITAHVDLRFPVFSVEEIARAMNLETQGRERGQQEQPPNDSTALDPVEVGILEEGRKWANRASKEWEEVAELQEVYQLAARIKAQIEKTLEAERIAVSDLKSEAKAPLDQSYLTRDHARDKKSAFEEFRREHSLSRASRYPESGIWNVAVLALIIIIEALFNGTQLATGLSTGLIGGWLQALIFAALNAGIAFLLGWSARFVFHRRVLLKAVGCTLVLIWIVWATGLNFGIAHFRNALAIDRDNASSIALADSMSHPLKVANFYSVLLLTMGLGFAIIAFIDGMRFEDLYPGYGPLDLDRGEAAKNFAENSASALHILAESKNGKLKNIGGEREYVYVLVAQHAEKAQRAERIRGHLCRYIQELDDAANRLAKIYRQVNRQARKTPAPIHFVLPLRVKNHDDDSGQQTRQDGFALERLNSCTDQIVATFDEIQRSFPTFEEL